MTFLELSIAALQTDDSPHRTHFISFGQKIRSDTDQCVCDRMQRHFFVNSFHKTFSPQNRCAAAAALIVIWFNLSHVYKLIMPANERKKDGNETKQKTEMQIDRKSLKYLEAKLLKE
jgi:hypothetical protein